MGENAGCPRVGAEHDGRVSLDLDEDEKPIMVLPGLIMLLLAAESGRQAYVHAAHSTVRACSDGVVAVIGLFGAACFLYIGIKGAKDQNSGAGLMKNEEERSRGDLLVWLVSSIVGAGVGISVFLSWLYK
ncbi:MAG: hypothetical protein JWN74_147 [Acidobacteriaceae bacterium]|nr:hypothetical protein [Acidobacteriaceae bacterium]